jgi:hypothetical protein
MSHVSSITNSSYPYRGTLVRLDANGDGVLSREEIAADQRPGLLSVSVGNQSADSGTGATSNLLAKLMQLPGNGKTDVKTAELMQPGTAASEDEGVDTQAAMDLYLGTYGQYAMDDMAA